MQSTRAHTKEESMFAAAKEANSALLRREVQQQATSYRALPEVVTLNHTNICNLRCVMCPRNLAQGTHRMPRSALSHVANRLFPTAKKLVLTTSEGEPLGADFEFLLEHALRFEVKVDAVTNGMLLTRDLYRQGRAAFDHINVSLDSHVPDVYERIRLGASHSRVFGNLHDVAALRREEPDDVLLSVSAVVMRSNISHLNDFIRTAAEIGVDGVILQRLLHTTKRTREEALEPDITHEDLNAALDAASATAQEVGINLFTSEFGRPHQIANMPRAKIPPSIEGHGTCWLIAQNFMVMYTGEVYPCCIPTDHVLGNVHYQDPVEIWNSAPFQRLRAAQLSGNGKTFCAGCLHAPHLAAPRVPSANRAIRKTKIAVAHVKNKIRRRWQTKFKTPIYAPTVPSVPSSDLELDQQEHRTTIAESPIRADVMHVDPATGRAHWIHDGGLWRSDQVESNESHELLHQTSQEEPSLGSIVFPTSSGVLFGFEGGGRLLRLRDGQVSKAVEFSDPASFARNSGIAKCASGEIWVGEYGAHPSARCAHMYRSEDGGRSFSHAKHLRDARHVHLVRGLPDRGVVVTTGDLAAERRMFHCDSGSSFRQICDAWAGFTAAAFSPGVFHFGTDLRSNNGFVRFHERLTATPEYRRFPEACDAPVRSLISVDDHRLLAWCRIEDDAVAPGENVWGALLFSEDAGEQWSVVHRSAGPPESVPESIELISRDPLRVLTTMSSQPELLEIR